MKLRTNEHVWRREVVWLSDDQKENVVIDEKWLVDKNGVLIYKTRTSLSLSLMHHKTSLCKRRKNGMQKKKKKKK